MRKREGMEPRNGYSTVDADVVMFTEGHIKGAQPAMAPANPPGSKTVARHQGSVGNSGDPLGSSRDGSRVAQPAHREETRRPRGSRMPPYERGRGVTPTEQRGAQRGARSLATPATRRGGTTATTGIERLATRARQAPQPRYTALLHHFTVDNLRACCEALDGSKAPGVAGGTKAMYGQHLEANLQALHDRLHRLSSRPQPVRWVEILKDNGRSPLLLNVALHGMEHALGTSYTPRGVTRGTYAVVRYADDFAVFCPMQAQAIEARSLLATWLKARGLKLSDAKTHIRHLQEGFNF